jgi:hypothetical protein
MGAPPARAANAPRSARKNREAPDTAIRKDPSQGQEWSDARPGGETANAGEDALELRRQNRNKKRQCRSHRETAGPGEGRLNWTRRHRLGDAEFVAGMRAERVMRHQLVGDLFRQGGIKAALDIDRRQLGVFALVVRLQLAAFEIQVRSFRIGLRMHGNIFACGHRHRAGDKTGDARHQHAASRAVRGCDAKHQARCRKDAVVRAQHRRPQPASVSAPMPFNLARHSHRRASTERSAFFGCQSY